MKVRTVYMVDSLASTETRVALQKAIVDTQLALQEKAVLARETKRAAQAVAGLRKTLPSLALMERVTRVSQSLTLYDKYLTPEDREYLQTTLRENVPKS